MRSGARPFPGRVAEQDAAAARQGPHVGRPEQPYLAVEFQFLSPAVPVAAADGGCATPLQYAENPFMER